MDLRSRAATEGSANRDMGRDHSSDEDYEPARTKTRTGHKGGPTKNTKQEREETKGGEIALKERSRADKSTKSTAAAVSMKAPKPGVPALSLREGPVAAAPTKFAASASTSAPTPTSNLPKAPAPAKTPPKPAASPEPPKTEETQDPSKAQAETQDPPKPEVTEDQSVVKAAKAPPEQEEKQDPSAGDPPGGNPSKAETMDEKQAPVAPSLTLEGTRACPTSLRLPPKENEPICANGKQKAVVKSIRKKPKPTPNRKKTSKKPIRRSPPVAVSSPKSTPSRGMFSPHAPVESSGDFSDEKGETPTQMTNLFADLPVDEAPIELPECYLFLGEKRPRERRSGTSDIRSNIAEAHVDVPNHADAIPRLGYRSWSQVMLALEYYAALKGFRYRIRSSQPIARCPRSDRLQIPDAFEFGFKNFRCIHGVMQASRDGGVGESKVNFTDCKALFDAVVTRVDTKQKQMVWCILIKNEWGMHNHHADKGKRVRGINDVPADGPVADHIAALADAGAGSKQIASYATSELGQTVSSQVIRNVLRRMHGNSSAAERLKNLLHELKQVDGSDVLVIQDDLEITCGIVIQTRVQKLACEQWGENLTLNFTHGTNNLGYHLGSFVATGPTGRGIPVLDFLALNETADIMTEIFEFFKRTNPTTWENIQTFVIDKHFVEWKCWKGAFRT
ncbi:hypothetical protein PF007_g24384 [Phytophthora fragariae]|uniref:ZSWIM1/3 RNaseH-like domain-containing protein n=2 Tax=Phytophthora fragariae TaxID=53985 RepID=A0A6A3SA49_9STRA|nr:hypothetical protein PF007_g24384 [Phytophthora fragariae]KAE9108384.1 hypothetical protein PF006_g20891 [Phytophthora fragariae]KAE9293876.1 hypothetical protein PF001_g18054 [Phytophthora fragariae]